MTNAAEPDGLLCHCAAGADGHAPGAGDCAEVVKAGTYRRDPLPEAPTSARGTCRECGKTVTVRRVELRHGIRRGDGSVHEAGVAGVWPAVAAHKVAGEACPGSGDVPAETRYCIGREAVSIYILRDEGRTLLPYPQSMRELVKPHVLRALHVATGEASEDAA